jgi:UrcA family protein
MRNLSNESCGQFAQSMQVRDESKQLVTALRSKLHVAVATFPETAASQYRTARVDERKSGKHERRNVMSTRSLIAAATAVGIATMSLFSVSAQAESEAPSVTVSLERYDLSKQSDADLLYVRLQRAAREVCRPLESRELSFKRLHTQCFENALQNAVASVDDVKLTALHQSDSELRIASRTPRSRT